MNVWYFTRPYLAYTKNHQNSYIFGINTPVSIGVNCGYLYLNWNLYHSTIYPNVANINVTNILRCSYGNGKFDKKIIWNDLELFVDSNHFRKVFNRPFISWILFDFINMVFIGRSWKDFHRHLFHWLWSLWRINCDQNCILIPSDYRIPWHLVTKTDLWNVGYPTNNRHHPGNFLHHKWKISVPIIYIHEHFNLHKNRP